MYSNRKYGNRSISSTSYGAAHPERGDTAHHSDSGQRLKLKTEYRNETQFHEWGEAFL